MKTDVTIRDIMNDNPVIISRKASVMDAAREMKGEGVGSLIIVDNGVPVGIVTECDILRKVVAEGKIPQEVMVEDIMSSPPVTVSPDASLEEAIKLMGTHHIRRLPVVQDGKLVGMATERDMLQVSPLLLDVARELAAIGGGSGERPFRKREGMAGKCEGCGMLTDRLTETDGHLFCESCAETYG
ncbi:MAG TPA: CBS domain-containing protein [Thermoplasmatales archaeon]|nr:CBS domain-containing protein [Thermoplasmatales archaeon]